METDVAVMAERRAKLAKLRSEHFVAGREVTSAPRVTSVDEFSQVRDGDMERLTTIDKTQRVH